MSFSSFKHLEKKTLLHEFSLFFSFLFVHFLYIIIPQPYNDFFFFIHFIALLLLLLIK